MRSWNLGIPCEATLPTADEAAAREADKVALANCLEKKVLPSLNFSLGKYGASKDKSMRHIVKDVVQRFQPMLKVLPQTVQKQLAEAQAAVAAEAGRKRAAKRKRRSEEDGGGPLRQPPAQQSRNAVAQDPPAQPPMVQQNGHTAAQCPTTVQTAAQHSAPAAAQDQPAAAARIQQNGSASKGGRRAAPARSRRKAAADAGGEADAGFSSDSSDLPEGIVGSAAPQPKLRRLKRKREMEAPSTQPVGSKVHPEPGSSAHVPPKGARSVPPDAGNGVMKASPASMAQALQDQPSQLGRLFSAGSTRAPEVTQRAAKQARFMACQASGAPAACNAGALLPRTSQQKCAHCKAANQCLHQRGTRCRTAMHDM